MPAPEPPAAPNRPSDGPWPGPGSAGARAAGRHRLRAGRGVHVVAPVALDRGRDRPQGAEPAEHRGRAGAEGAGSAAVVERLGEQHVVVDVPAQRRRGGSCRRTGKLDRGCGRRLRCRCEGRGRGLVGGGAGMRDGVALGRVAGVGPPRRAPARVRETAQAPTPPVPGKAQVRAAAAVPESGGTSGTGVGVDRRLRRRAGSPAIGRVGLLCACRGRQRERERERGQQQAGSNRNDGRGLAHVGSGPNDDID